MEDAISPIEWWMVKDFSGRISRVTTTDTRNGEHYIEQHSTPVPDGEIICDACSAPIVDFPCPVVTGYALCKKCSVEWTIHDGDEEYFESFAYACGDEPKDPGVNCGGRKRKK